MKHRNNNNITKEEIVSYLLERLFSLEVREKDFIFRRELERLSTALPGWEEQEALFIQLKTLAEERGFRII